jgi:hypothetical protein
LSYPFSLLVMLASSTSSNQHFYEIVTLCIPPPHQDRGRARTAGNRVARDDKELGAQLGETLTRFDTHMGVDLLDQKFE